MAPGRRLRLSGATALTALACACGLDVLGTESPLTALEAGVLDGGGVLDSGGSEVLAPPPTPPQAEAGTKDAAGPPIIDAGFDAASTCTEPGARTYGGHCYFVLASGNRADGKAKCDAANAHLVSIANAAEQSAIESMGTGDRWIGLFGTVPTNNDKNKFQWPDGKTITYDHWKVGNPNEGFACVVMDRADGDVWTDRSCSDGSVTRALCERD